MVGTGTRAHARNGEKEGPVIFEVPQNYRKRPRQARSKRTVGALSARGLIRNQGRSIVITYPDELENARLA